MNNLQVLLKKIPPLSRNSHKSLEYGCCVMEAVSYIAREPWSDSPTCACPVISTFLRNWNDNLSDDKRDTLLRPLVPLLVNTRSTRAVEQLRSKMAADWLIREHTPAWLRLAGLTTQANALAALPEITNFTQCLLLMRKLETIRRILDAALHDTVTATWAAAKAASQDAALASAGDAARVAAWDAERDAAEDTPWAAARDAAWAASRNAAEVAAGNATKDAAGITAWPAAAAAVATTKQNLQQSALRLIHRMIETK